MDRRNFLLGFAVACVIPTVLVLKSKESLVAVDDFACWFEQAMDYCEEEFTVNHLAEMKNSMLICKIEPTELKTGIITGK